VNAGVGARDDQALDLAGSFKNRVDTEGTCVITGQGCHLAIVAPQTVESSRPGPTEHHQSLRSRRGLGRRGRTPSQIQSDRKVGARENRQPLVLCVARIAGGAYGHYRTGLSAR